MDAAARTARALAHELANYLGAMRSTLYLLADDAPDDPEVRQDLDTLARAFKEAAELLEELRRFAKAQPIGTGSVDLNEVLREAEPELHAAMRAGTKLRVRLGSEPLVVRGDQARLRLLILDLVTTMGHSLAEGGRVEIVATPAPDHALENASALLLASGDGPGLEPERAARIFEPFVFDKSGNAGLKLATVYTTVVESGGTIAAESAPGEGTTIRLTLPLATAAAAGENPAR
ncbi:MAG: ATP-binding protein [Gemmatimonadales bacterium]|jgi:signal transduction histidine kinase